MDNFDKIKDEAELKYKEIDTVYCPFLKQDILFNSRGLDHLKFKRERIARNKKDQISRFKNLHLVSDIVSRSHTLQGIQETQGFEKIRIHSRTDTKLVKITYYEFFAVVADKRIKVIIKKVQDSSPFFWSVIPYWGKNKNNSERKLHDTNLVDE